MKFSLSLLFCLFIYSSPSLAWGPQEHQVIGHIADELIKGSKAEQEVKNILGDDGSLAFIAGWADCVKSVRLNKTDNSFYYDNEKHYQDCDKYENNEDQIKYAADNWSSCEEYHPGGIACHNRYHFTDVAIERDEYRPGEYGTSSADIVHAINAAITKLKGGTPATPFKIETKKDALRLLVHLVGDETQPLHVVSVYLNKQGEVVDPDKKPTEAFIENEGGNKLYDGSVPLHSQWDSVKISELEDNKWRNFLPGAENIKPPSGDIMDWSTEWANDSIAVGKNIFLRLTFSQYTKIKNDKNSPDKNGWFIGHDTNEALLRDNIQQQQLQKGGANLANLLKAIYQ